MERSARCSAVHDPEKIVVAICTYNNAQLLDRTLAAIERQQVDPSVRWSVLVVDNNSTDETPAVVRKYIQAGRVPGLRITCEPHQGLSHARRRAVRETSSKVIAFVDDDCLLEPDWIQQAVAFCGDHPMAGAVGGRVRLLWEAPPNELLLRHEGALARQDHGDVPCQMPATGMTYLVGAGLVVQRQALEASGWVDHGALVDRQGATLMAGGDSEIVLRIRRAHYELWYNPAMELHHYVPRQRMSVQHLARLQRGFGQSSPILSTLAKNQEPILTRRVHVLASSLKGIVGLVISIAIRDLLLKGRISPKRRMAFYKAIGRVEGSIRFLVHGYQL